MDERLGCPGEPEVRPGAGPELSLDILIEWLRSEGGFVHEGLIVARDAHGGSSLRVSKNQDTLEADITLLVVPRSAMLEAESNTALMIRLLEETRKGRSSYWHSYISFLPPLRRLSFLPLVSHFQEIEEKAFLKWDSESSVTRLVTRSASLARSFEAQMQQLIKDFIALDALSCSIEEWLWASCIVKNRALSLFKGPTLVPVVDWLNHSFPPNVRCRCGTDAPAKSVYSPPSTPDSSDDEIDEIMPACSLIVESARTMESDDELLWSYNSHDFDAQWLLNYGFIHQESRPQCEDFPQRSINATFYKEIDQETKGAVDLPPDHLSDSSAQGIITLLVRERDCCAEEAGVH